jgi:hypothetical protein
VPVHPNDGTNPVHVPRPEVGAQGLQRDVHHAGSVCAVHQGQDAGVPEPGHDVADREHQCGGRSDVLDDGQPGSIGHSRQDGSGELVHPLPGKRNRVDHQRGPAPGAGAFGGQADSSIHVVADQDLVAGAESDRGQHGVDGGGGVGDEHEATPVGMQEGRRRHPSLLERVGQHPPEEPGGVGFSPSPEPVLGLLDGRRDRAERAVVQVCHSRIDRPQGPNLGPVGAPHWVVGGLLDGRER